MKQCSALFLLCLNCLWCGSSFAGDTTNHIKLTIGQTYSLRISSNPSTGYSWKLAESTNQIVTLVTNDYEPDQHPEGKVGVGGKEHWIFKATGKGRAEMVLEYTRSWEKKSAPDRMILQFVCK